MSPPSSSPHEIENEYWTDEGICMSLLNFKNGKSLPSNVESEINPYKYRPQDLPGDLWYFCPVVKTESEFGFWVETGEPCEILSNSAICGFRTTFRFYEGKTPHERKTDWVMQEYKINVNDQKALSRIFFAVENSSDMECILTGDFFELNDLVDDPDDDENMKHSSIKFNLSATINSKLVICPNTTVSVKSETCEAKEEDMNKSTSNGVIKTSTKSSSSCYEVMFEEDKKESVSKKKGRKMMKYLCFLAF
ncbi:unnamed protein product [Lactuca saligna]|uniref:NAC domain-containing protein n=1 Tax=Lactuca saligna TaxID=75948 RepID=A0AA35YBZ2_LACSI|nr:unnamed protein product [Lactuca saligna]